MSKITGRIYLTVFLLAIFSGSVSAADTDKVPAANQVIGAAEQPVENITAKKLKQDIARDRVTSSDEDPLTKREAEKQEDIEAVADKPDRINLYGSVRIRYSADEVSGGWSDGGSRIGLNGQWQFMPKYWIFGRGEVGFNLLTGLDQLRSIFNSSGNAPEGKFTDSVFERLLYVGVETPNNYLIYGKNWSSFYQIAGFTDRFNVGGGNASGAYNAGTDGGASGTGRANQVLQSRLHLDVFPEFSGIAPFNLNVQLQHGQPIPLIESGQRYGTQFGLSAVLTTKRDYTIGLAYNRSNIADLNDPAIQAAGIDGDDQAFLIGTRWFGEKWYLGTVISRLYNHMTTNELKYFNGTGWEVYGNYNVYGRISLVGGWNYLRPDDDQLQAKQFLLKYGVLGLRYSFEGLTKLLFAQANINDGRLADGTPVGNSYSVGVRWDLP